MFLDKRSKKILKYIISNCNGDFNNEIEIPPTAFKITHSELSALCLNLYHLGLLSDVISYDDAPIKVFLSYSGYQYFKKFRKWWSDNWISFTTLIATVITLFVTLMK